MRGDTNPSPMTPPPTMRAADRRARDPAGLLGRSCRNARGRTGCAATTRATRGQRAGDPDHDDATEGHWGRLGRPRKWRGRRQRGRQLGRQHEESQRWTEEASHESQRGKVCRIVQTTV